MNEEEQAHLEALREQCAVLDRRGKPGTLWHDELARLEAKAAGQAPLEQEEDVDNGTP